MPGMIQLQNVSARVRHKGRFLTVLHDCSFTFSGSHMGLLAAEERVAEGIIDLLAGYMRPRTGRILRPLRISWPIGRLLQFRSELNGRDTLRFFCALYKLDFRKAERFILDMIDFDGLYLHPTEEWPGLLIVKLAQAAVLLPRFDIYLGEGSLVVGDDDFMERWNPVFRSRLDAGAMLIMSCSQQVFLEKYVSRVAVAQHGCLRLYEDLDAAFGAIGNISTTDGPQATPVHQVMEDDF